MIERIVARTGGISFTVPGTPRAWQRTGYSRKTKQFYTKEKTRSYEGAIRFLGKLAMAGRAPFAGSIAVEILAHFPVPSSWSRKRRALALDNLIQPTGRPDADNIAKALQDSLNKICFNDDSQIVDLRIIKRYGSAPGIYVSVTPLVDAVPA